MEKEKQPNIILRQEAISAMEEIEFLKQKCATMGANDYEITTLNSLIEEVRSGATSPADALTRAYEVESSKQDYH